MPYLLQCNPIVYQLWIAEGMVLFSDKREGKTMIHVAESYLGQLVHKSMVQVRLNDLESSVIKFKSVSLHDLMRDLSLFQAKMEDFFEEIDLREGNDYLQNLYVDSMSGYTRLLAVYYDHRYTSANSYFGNRPNHQQVPIDVAYERG